MRSASPSADCTSIRSPLLAASAVRVAMPASGSPAARSVFARRIWAVTYQGEVSGTAERAAVASAYCSSASRISAATSWASTRSGRICAARRACTSATRCELAAVQGIGEGQESFRGAVARAGDQVEGDLLAGGEPVAQLEQRGVGEPGGQRLVDDRDGVGLAAELGEDLGVGDDGRAVEVQRPVLAAGEDRLGRDEVAGEREHQGLVYWP